MDIADFQKWHRNHKEELLAEFFSLLRFKSISADHSCKPDCESAAEWLRAYMQRIGLDSSLWPTPGLPVVFASHLKAGPHRPTLLIYHHYDVQPVDPLELWDSPPFEPQIREGKIYARGAVDNKGQCFCSLAAIRAFLELSTVMNFNLKVLIEGEEESGSQGTSSILERYQKELQADYLLVVDFDMAAVDTPGVTLGMRGLVTLEVVCRNSYEDLHSGIHGGIALNPNRALIQLLARLWDEKGRVCVPHFYEGIASLDPLSQFDGSFDQQAYTQAFGVHAFGTEEGVSIRESNWLRPTLEINGISGGYTGVGFKTVIPAQASAKISCRLVPGQDPIQIGSSIAAYLKALSPEGLELSVHCHGGAPAYRCAVESSLVALLTAAYKEVFGAECKRLLCGASVPVISRLAAVCGAEVALIGVGLSSDAIHAPNEHFDLDRFEKGFLAMACILERCSRWGLG